MMRMMIKMTMDLKMKMLETSKISMIKIGKMPAMMKTMMMKIMKTGKMLEMMKTMMKKTP